MARFYMARGLYPEAKGVLDLALSATKPGQEDPAAMIGHAAASALMWRPDQTLKDIANPAIASTYDAQMWKGVALARQGKWPEAREKLKSVQFAITALRSLAYTKGITIPASPLGKIKMASQVTAILLLILGWGPLPLLDVVIGATIALNAWRAVAVLHGPPTGDGRGGPVPV